MKMFDKIVITFLCSVLSVVVHAQSSHWYVNAYDYQYDMTVYFTVGFDGVAVSDLDSYEVAAFVGSECRGVGRILTQGENQYGYLRVHSNNDSGEAFTFRVYNHNNSRKYGVKDVSLTFQSQTVVGMPSTPIMLSLSSDCTISVMSSDETKGMAEGGVTVNYDVEVTVTATTYEGYHFVSWTLGETVVSTDASYTFTADGDMSLVANFAPNQYSMTFVLDNGEENVVKTQDYGSGLTAPEDPVKTGFTFKGWSPEVPATVPASHQTFTAQWERNSYKLTWDVDGVKTEMMLEYEAAITKPDAPVKDGYTFAGWTPEVAETMPAEDVTYTATWNANQYAIGYNLDGGSLAEGVINPTSYTVENEDITLANPTREGYTFAGWTGTDLTEATQTVTITTGSIGNRTYTATWAVNQYTMTFTLDNGEENVVKTQDYGSGLTAPEDPVKTGFTFKGWSPEVPATVPASDQTFTAQWERNSYKLTWDVDGVKTEMMLEYEAAITKPDDPVKDGYTFAGWTPEVAATMPAEDVTYTATWTINQYTIGYNLDGGSLAEGVTNPTSYTIESEDITLANPTREGYTFAGWTGTDLTEATQTVTITAGSIGNRNYTATWAVNQYTMTFVLDNGEENLVKTQDYGSGLTAPEDPVKTGFTFKGWSPEVPATVPASDQTFTAQWERNSYKLTWDVDGVKTEMMLEYGAAIIKPDDPVKDGYTFAGWTPEVAATMPAEDVTYTATWNVDNGIVTISSVDKLVNVYDLNGRRIRSNVSVLLLSKELPSGIYIIEGKKVLIAK